MSTNQLLALFPTELRKAILSAVEDKSMKQKKSAAESDSLFRFWEKADYICCPLRLLRLSS